MSQTVISFGFIVENDCSIIQRKSKNILRVHDEKDEEIFFFSGNNAIYGNQEVVPTDILPTKELISFRNTYFPTHTIKLYMFTYSTTIT